MEDLLAVCIEEIGFDGEQGKPTCTLKKFFFSKKFLFIKKLGCSVPRLWSHVTRRFPEVTVDEPVKDFLLSLLLQSPFLDCHRPLAKVRFPPFPPFFFFFFVFFFSFSFILFSFFHSFLSFFVLFVRLALLVLFVLLVRLVLLVLLVLIGSLWFS